MQGPLRFPARVVVYPRGPALARFEVSSRNRGMGASDRQREVSDRDQQARFRFSVIGPLLAAPPARGELQQALQELAARSTNTR